MTNSSSVHCVQKALSGNTPVVGTMIALVSHQKTRAIYQNYQSARVLTSGRHGAPQVIEAFSKVKDADGKMVVPVFKTMNSVFVSSLHDLEKVLSHRIVMFHVAECFVHDEASTVNRCVKRIPPYNEQDMERGAHL